MGVGFAAVGHSMDIGMQKFLSPWLFGLLAAVAISPALARASETPEQLLLINCASCHEPNADGELSRISGQRKLPEGWEMTIERMRWAHGVELRAGDPGMSERDISATLVKYLSDKQGLAPAEAQGYRYTVEKRLNFVENFDPYYAEMCARCHSGSRAALQRRQPEEWRRLVHFHLAQYPSTEYSSGGRNRDWLNEALTAVVPHLSETYAFNDPAWEAWQRSPRPKLAGRWLLVGKLPGKGRFHGVMRTQERDRDHYSLELEGSFIRSGETFQGAGSAIVYTGFEWRAFVELNGQAHVQALAAETSADGVAMRGRMFMPDQHAAGMDLRAIRVDDNPSLVAAFPNHLRIGTTAVVTLFGDHLGADLDLGAGVRVLRTLEREEHQLRVEVQVAGDATPGRRTIRLGDAKLEQGLTLYRKIGRLAIEPGYAVARVGAAPGAGTAGDGGPLPALQAHFEAVVFAPGADGMMGTDDDLRLGSVPASWSVQPWNDQAKQDGDVHFAGVMDPATGVFTPAAAGPNPERKYGTNNFGRLAVIARVMEAQETLQDKAELLVTTQRWIDPPIY